MQLGARGRGRRALCAALACSFTAPIAAARPQANSALVAALCGSGDRQDWMQQACFYGGLRADLVLLRESPRDFGLGPYVAVTTVSFDDVRFGSGATLHLPVHESLPLLVSVGGYARYSGVGWEPGLSTRLFFGSRSYNYTADYVLGFGLVAGLDYGLGRSEEIASLIGVQVDGFFLAAPFVLLVQALRH